MELFWLFLLLNSKVNDVVNWNAQMILPSNEGGENGSLTGDILNLEKLDYIEVKDLIWNVRGVGGVVCGDRVRNLCKVHNITFLVLMEPLIAASKLASTAKVHGFNLFFYIIAQIKSIFCGIIL
ncbi:hypothetical protein M5K25_003937 [Dendrobium thyrsiflorum]|uniref:Uncharacterized protein n=1 Tax=Dendrobium thyrsiflorum TaxID=117978 RepID=A0ABD0VLT8_DENTH